MKRRGVLLVCCALVTALLVAACGDEVEAPTDDLAPGDSPLTLMADGFAHSDVIPTRFTCDGDDVSPHLTWTGVPEGTQAFAIIVDDPDAPTEEPFVHFVVYDLPGSERELEEAIPVPAHPSAGGYQGRNDFGRTGWGGPCPPEGETHNYVFRLYALSEELGLDPGATKEDVLEAMGEDNLLALDEMVASYGR